MMTSDSKGHLATCFASDSAIALGRVLIEGLRTLYIPVALSISSEEEQALARFVEEGGKAEGPGSRLKFAQEIKAEKYSKKIHTKQL